MSIVRGTVGYGYRIGETDPDMPRLQLIKKDVEITLNPNVVDDSYRPPMQVSLGPHVRGAALPHTDSTDADTTLAGCCKRSAFSTPEPEEDLLIELENFVSKFCHDNFVPLEPEVDTSVEKWLTTTHYAKWRQAEILDAWYRINGTLEKKHFEVKLFVKDECYAEYKHSRAINSRTDEFKAAVGPIFRLIEKEVFKLDWFIKKVPVNERPAYIKNRLDDVSKVFLATDHTAYEAHFVAKVMRRIEMVLYRYMTKNIPDGVWFIRLIKRVLLGRNICKNKLLTMKIDATRMSGEMNTSLGNGFSNLMLMLFAAYKCGCRDVMGVVEGDDGLFSMTVPEGASLPDAKFFARMGFTLKLDVHEDISTASFCGLVFDSEEQMNVTNVLEELVAFAWASKRYARCGRAKHEQLLRCKSFSMAYQYPGCPILKSLARYGLRVTRKHGKIGSSQFTDMVNKHVTNVYYREQIHEALEKGIPNVDIGHRTRLLVERLYGVTIERQLETERYLDSLESIQELDLPDLLLLVPPVWMNYSTNYVRAIDATMMDKPVELWPSRYSEGGRRTKGFVPHGPGSGLVQ